MSKQKPKIGMARMLQLAMTKKPLCRITIDIGQQNKKVEG